MPKFGPGRDDVLQCSFCGKSQHEVAKIIAGPGVYICDQCVDLCNEIIVQEAPDRDLAREPSDEDLEAAARTVNEAVSRLHRLAVRRRAAPAPPPER